MHSSHLLLALLLTGPGQAIYRGEVRLPLELYTAGGEIIPSGKQDLEIRLAGSEYLLVFVSGQKMIASIPGKAANATPGFNMPVVGTILLQRVEEEKKEEKKEASEMKSRISPYLTNLSWKATLRLYQATAPSSKELRAVFRDEAKRVEFPLFSERPATKPNTP
jgi:hypothetical protein